jgi:hypothetical protein
MGCTLPFLMALAGEGLVKAVIVHGANDTCASVIVAEQGGLTLYPEGIKSAHSEP